MADWQIEPSTCSVATINPIRNIVDKIVRPQNHPLSHIDLALGDPSSAPLLQPHPATLAAINTALTIPREQGYTNSMGLPSAREAIAEFMRRDGVDYKANDIVVANGASGALLLVLQLLTNPGDAFLIPTPGFSLYKTLLGHLGVEAIEYNLIPERQWEMDLDHITALLTTHGKKVKGIVINNPGNPTGSNFAREHLVQFNEIVTKFRIPVLADEIYAYMVMKDQVFTPFAQIAEEVPVFTISGLAKQFLVPGWRVGWIAVSDKKKVLTKALPHLTSLTQVILGACTLVQAAVPAILKAVKETPEIYTATNDLLETQARAMSTKLAEIPGLTCIDPQGAMYLMVQIKVEEFVAEIKDDASFCQLLLNEQNIMLLPGSCFGAHNFFRIVYCAGVDVMTEAVGRIAEFCQKHRK